MTIIVCNKITGYITLFIQDVNKEKVLWTKSDKNINTSSNVASSLDVCNICIYSPPSPEFRHAITNWKKTGVRCALLQAQDSDITKLTIQICNSSTSSRFRHTVHQNAHWIQTYNSSTSSRFRHNSSRCSKFRPAIQQIQDLDINSSTNSRFSLTIQQTQDSENSSTCLRFILTIQQTQDSDTQFINKLKIQTYINKRKIQIYNPGFRQAIHQFAKDSDIQFINKLKI